MDEFLAEPTPAEQPPAGDDPFGMPAEPAAPDGDDPFGVPEPLAPPSGGDDAFGGGMDSFAPPAEGGDNPFGGSGEDPMALPAAEPLPTFGEPAADPMADAMGGMPAADGMGDAMGGGMGDPMGGMDGMGGMGGMGDMPPAPPSGLGDEFAAPASLGPVAKWRIEQSEKLSAKAAQAEAALAERFEEAQAKLTQFYAEREEKTAKRAAENREAEKRYVEERDAAMIADSWESVCKLVDVKEKENKEEGAKDTSRMRQVLLKLKHT